MGWNDRVDFGYDYGAVDAAQVYIERLIDLADDKRKES